MKNKNREHLLRYVLNALEQHEFMSYQEIVDDIEYRQNISLDCYDIPTTAVKGVILDYGIYANGEVPKRYNGESPLFIANDQKETQNRNVEQIKWKKINY